MYLNITNDPYYLTLCYFLLSSIIFVINNHGRINLKKHIKNKTYLLLALFNIGCLLFTNIGINQINVSFTYMIKSSEPVFILLLSYIILNEKFCLKVTQLTLIPICFGVFLIIYGEINNFNLFGILCAFLSNISTAARTVYFKFESTKTSLNLYDSFDFYILVSTLSFVLYSPFYLFKILFKNTNYLESSFNLKELKYLFLAITLNLLYNLLSFKILTNSFQITHSILNSFKRIVIVVSSLIYFQIKIKSIQLFGIILADIGVLFYLIFKLKNYSINYKFILNFILIIILVLSIILSFFSTNNNLVISLSYNISNNHIELNRLMCLNKIREEIIDKFKSLNIPKDRDLHIAQIPLHNNHGDSMIWYGEMILIKELKLKYNSSFFMNTLNNQQDIILIQGGGNFGDLWRELTIDRNKLIIDHKNNLKIIMPQTIHYSNMSLVAIDSDILSNDQNLILTVRSLQSYEFAKNYFNKTKILLVPDMAFMLGNIKPLIEAKYDVIFLVRSDIESNNNYLIWKNAAELIKYNGYTYIIRDWMDLKLINFVKFENWYIERTNFANKLLSLGKVVITDRLHASILSILMGKHHVIVDEKHKKIYNTRQTAFDSKPECHEKYLKAYYAKNPIDAANITISILKNYN